MLMEMKLSSNMCTYIPVLNNTIRTREAESWHIPKEVVEEHSLMYILMRLDSLMEIHDLKCYNFRCWCTKCDKYHTVITTEQTGRNRIMENKPESNIFDVDFCGDTYDICRALSGFDQDRDNSVLDYDENEEDDEERIRHLDMVIGNIQDELKANPNMETPEQGEFIFPFVRQHIDRLSNDIVQLLVHCEEGLEWCNNICYSHGISPQQEREEMTAMTARAQLQILVGQNSSQSILGGNSRHNIQMPTPIEHTPEQWQEILDLYNEMISNQGVSPQQEREEMTARHIHPASTVDITLYTRELGEPDSDSEEDEEHWLSYYELFPEN